MVVVDKEIIINISHLIFVFSFIFSPFNHSYTKQITKMGYDSTIRATSEKAEHLLGLVGTPIKPHLPSVSRFLIVATFYEDAMRILWQWSDQVLYLEKARHFPPYTAPLFLAFNACVSNIY